jgi:adenosylcobinamide-phosphate synthase
MRDRAVSRAHGLLLGYLLDLLLGDPRRGHPVAGFGHVAGRAEQRFHADSRAVGAAYTLTLVGTTAALGSAAHRMVRHRPALDVALTAATTWAVLGGASLAREAAAVHAHLERGDLAAGRDRVTHLVGRDPSRLDADGVARATVESVAENTSDAVVAPLFWGALAGPAGLLGYRAVNTLDAMVGHRSVRHRRFGWATARLDDLLNLVPARVSALLAAAAAPVVAGRPGAALDTWRQHARRHPSPNAGPVEASFAGALGVVLGGTNVYAGTVEDRGALGTGRPVAPADIPRAVRLARVVGTGSVILAASAATARRRRRR